MKRIVIYAPKDFLNNYFHKTKKHLFETFLRAFEKDADSGAILHTDIQKETITLDVSLSEERNELIDRILKALELNDDEVNNLNISIINLSDDFNEKDQHHTSSSQEKIKDKIAFFNGLKKKLEDNLVGQQHTIDAVTGELLNQAISSKEKVTPQTFLIAGPKGSGKNLFCRTIGEYYRDKLDVPFKVFDKADYEKNDTTEVLNSFVDEHHECILIFKNIENAYKDLIDFIYPLLTTGEAKNVSYKKVKIFVTTALGRKLYENSSSGDFSKVDKETVINAILEENNKKQVTANYFINRLSGGAVCMLNFTAPGEVREVLISKMKERFTAFKKETGIEVEGNIDQLATSFFYMNNHAYSVDSLYEVFDCFFKKEISDVFFQKGREGKSIALELEKIHYSFDVDNAPKEVKDLYANHPIKGLFVVPSNRLDYFTSLKIEGLTIIPAATMEQAKEEMIKGVDIVFLDVLLNYKKKKNDPTNIEDLNAEGVEFFNYVMTYFNDTPVFLLSFFANRKSAGDYYSLLSSGAKEVIPYGNRNNQSLTTSIQEIKNTVELEKDIADLIRQNKVITYNSSQFLSEDHRELNLVFTKMALVHANHSYNNKSLTNGRNSVVTFKDMVGNDNAKKILGYYIGFLKNSKQFIKENYRAPRAFLLYGEEGVGKKMTAEAFANESGARLFYKSGSDIVIDSNSNANNAIAIVQELFEKAKESSPSIILIDKIDILVSTTDNLLERKVMMSLIKEIDELNVDDRHPVLFFATTSKQKDELDLEFLRKLDRSIQYFLPSEKEREIFIRKCLEKYKITTISESAISTLTIKTAYYGFKDLATIINHAVRNCHGQALDDTLLFESMDQLEFGDENRSKDDLEPTAYHESGHFLVSYLLGDHSPFITIVSRGYYGGYTSTDIHEGHAHYKKQHFLDEICMCMAGRAAEYITYGEDGINAGVSSDLRHATMIAARMVGQYGMGKNLYAFFDLPYHEMPREMLEEINQIINEQYSRAVSLLEKNKKLLKLITKKLLEKKTLTGSEVEKLIEENKN